jgi:hypothetical protein
VRRIQLGSRASGGKHKGSQQQQREQMHRINPGRTRAQEFPVAASRNRSKAIEMIQAKNKSGQHEEKIYAHIPGLIYGAENAKRWKKSGETVSEMKENHKNGGNGADTRKAVQHFKQFPLFLQLNGRGTFSIARLSFLMRVAPHKLLPGAVNCQQQESVHR